MSMIEKKHRPSLTTSEIRLTTKWLDNAIRIAVQNAASINHAEIAGLVKIKDYLQSFTKGDSVAELIRQYSAKPATPQLDSIPPLNSPDPIQSNPAKRVSPLYNPDLTDDQILDILTLLDDNERTEEETKWYLNVGTIIKLQRMQKNGVKAGDL